MKTEIQRAVHGNVFDAEYYVVGPVLWGFSRELLYRAVLVVIDDTVSRVVHEGVYDALQEAAVQNGSTQLDLDGA